MGDMTLMGGGTDLLPWWVRLIWSGLFAWIAAQHLGHILMMRGQARWWHATHLLMATGMLYMFLAWQGPPISFDVWQGVYVAAAAAIVVFVAANWVRGRAVNLLWFVQLLAMGAMAYMFAIMGLLRDGHDPTVITLALAGYYVVEAAGWSRRHFAEADAARVSWLPFSIGPSPRAGGVCASNLCGRVPVDLAASGTVMALGMSYMFLDMDADARVFVQRAFTGGITGQSVLALIILAGVVLLVVPTPARSAARVAYTAARTPRIADMPLDDRLPAADGPGPAPTGARTGALTGTVCAGATRRPLPRAMVVLVDRTGQVAASTLTGEDGTYAFTDLGAGDYTVAVTGYHPEAAAVHLRAAVVTDVPMTLGPERVTAGAYPRHEPTV